MTKKTQINIRLTTGLKVLIMTLAESEGRSQTNMIERLLTEAINNRNNMKVKR